MLQILFKGSVISFIYVYNLFYLQRFPSIASIIFYFTIIIKILWLLQNKRSDIKNYLLFLGIFLLIILYMKYLPYRIHFSFGFYLQHFLKNTLDFIGFWQEIIFFIIFLIFNKKINPLTMVFYYMITEVVLMVIEEGLVYKNFYFLLDINKNYHGFYEIVQNLLFYYREHMSSVYFYYNSFFHMFIFVTLLNKIFNIKNLEIEDVNNIIKVNIKVVWTLVFLIFTIFQTNYLLPNIWWFKMQIKLLLILLAYMENIGYRYFYYYLDQWTHNNNNLFFIFILLMQFLTSKHRMIFYFCIGFFTYIIEIINKYIYLSDEDLSPKA